MHFQEIDIKTGISLQEPHPETGILQPKQKESNHCYLEHWLKNNEIEAPFWVGKFYEGVQPLDRERLEADGKVLVFTNGKDGYFTDPQTAQWMTTGEAERGIAPIYAADRHSPHNLVAYGSLLASDGMAATEVKHARILVIDDENRSCGVEPLRDRQGQLIPPAHLEALYDKMGDGTLLISQQVMGTLITPEEQAAIAQQVFKKAGLSADVSNLANEYSELDPALQQIERQTNALVQRTVTQFRAATPNLPGMIKGTMTTSDWCERLGVDAILSKNDIKGDDGRLSSLGIKTVDSFWLNRKSDGKYGEQVVGPQVKGCIPKATLTELNPQMQAQAQEISQIASQPQSLLQYYVHQKDKQHALKPQGDEKATESQPDWLYEVAQEDKFGLLTGFSKINRELDRFLHGERVDNAVGGIYVPSAMAQHHSQLEPWEVCNKSIPHGAIVAYYRSPFPNVGAAAIAINNTEILKQEDPEALRKDGVAYLNPWTAKHIAITDFDRDANGYFVGLVPTVPDLPEQIRAQLAEMKNSPPAEQYEAGRALFGQMIQQMKAGEESRLALGRYPIAVTEFIERNAPAQKPPEIIKQKKVKHPWHAGESHAAATWRAWETTANNPTGMVANCGMVLQSLALETQFIPDEKKESLLQQISSHYGALLKKVEAGKLQIPSDEELAQKGFPAYSFQQRIHEIAQANHTLREPTDPLSRQEFVQRSLNKVHRLLSDFVDGPNAENLQTAVDTAKSSRGIDQAIQALGNALAHKEHLLRQNQKDPSIYLQGKEMPTNTEEPIGWAVQASNQLYQDTQLPELKNESFRNLFPKDDTPEQEARALEIAKTYNSLVKAAAAAGDRLREKRPADLQPTLTVTVPASGSPITLERLCDRDSSNQAPIWRANGSSQSDWSIVIERNPRQNAQQPEPLVAHLHYLDAAGKPQCAEIGAVSEHSTQEHDLIQRLAGKASLTIQAPIVEIHPPWVFGNDPKDQLTKASQYLKEAISHILPDERTAYAAALWRYSEGMGVALKAFTPEVVQQLQTCPEITLTGIQRETNQAGQIPEGVYQARFGQIHYTTATGEPHVSPSVAVVLDGEEKPLGAIDARSIRPAMGTLVEAHIRIEESGKIARMQVLDRVQEPENLTPYDGGEKRAFAVAAEPSQSYPINQATRTDDIYNPTRQDLLDWYKVVQRQDNPERLGHIKALGQTLKNLYNLEQGMDSHHLIPPADYQHPSVQLSPENLNQMKTDLQSGKFEFAKSEKSQTLTVQQVEC